jgi:DHA2 family multidrug resistance protein
MITISIMLANIMQGVDNTILNVALPHVQGSLSASVDQIAWAGEIVVRDAIRKTIIVALARKLLIALWRLVTTGEVPEGVIRRPAL